MKLRFLGGGAEVGASCTLIQIDGKSILVDAGIRMGPSIKTKWPDFRGLRRPDALLLTHAHSDHTGALPLLAKEDRLPEKVYCTPPTREITRVLFDDAVKREEKCKSPEYTADDVNYAFSRMESVPWKEPVQIGDGVTATWIRAGHVLGAAMIYIESEQESILMTGDVSGDDQLTIPGMDVPELCRLDVMVMESTYGNRRHRDRAQQETALVQDVTEVIEAGGKVLIPAFAVARSQEVIRILKDAMERKQIPMYIDGMVKRVNEVYSSHVDDLNPSLAGRATFRKHTFYSEFVKKVDKKNTKERVLSGSPCCIVASSGMLKGGVSVDYARHLVEDPKNLIAIVGYQGEGTPGHELENLSKVEEPEDRKWKLDQEVSVNVNCNVKRYSLSAHADQRELAELVKKLRPNKCFLVHGDDAARESLAKSVRELAPSVDVRLPRNGGTYTCTKRVGITDGRQFSNNKILAELNAFLQEIGATGPFRAWDLAEYWYGTNATTRYEEKLFQFFLTLDWQEAFIRDRQSPHLFHRGWDS